MKKHYWLAAFLFGVFVYAFYLVFNVPISDYDIWFHLKTGEYVVNNLAVPIKDVFSWTAYGNPWITHSWGAEVIQWFIYNQWGFFGLKLVNSLIAGLTVVILSLTAYVKSKKFLPLIILFPLLLVTDSSFWPAGRPQIFTFLFFSIVALILFLDTKKKYLITLPLIFFVWANIHGGVSLGLYLWAALIAAGVIPKLKSIFTYLRANIKEILLFFISFGLTLVNPNGLHIYLYPDYTVELARKMGISEWQSIWQGLNYIPLQLQVITGVGFFIVMFLNYRKKIWLQPHFWIGVFFSILPFYAVRLRIFFSFVLFILFAVEATKLIKKKTPKLLKHDRLFAEIFAIALIIKIIIVPKTFHIYDANEHPVAAANFIERTGLSGRMFNTYNYGGYLLFRMPNPSVFIDGRFDPYLGTDVLEDHDKLMRTLPGWEETLINKYPIDYAILPYGPERNPLGLNYPARLHLELTRGSDFIPVYIDRRFVIFVRNERKNIEYIDKYNVKNLVNFMIYGPENMTKAQLESALKQWDVLARNLKDDQFLTYMKKNITKAIEQK